MKLTILAVGKTTTPYIADALEDYVRRINHYVQADVMIVGVGKGGGKALTAEHQKETDCNAIMRALEPTDRVILLDERGKEFTSREFAEELQRRMTTGMVKRMVFVIGGPFGFTREMYERADAKISLSRMTFTHEMVRLFFAEQIYRAMTILRGEPYHHD